MPVSLTRVRTRGLALKATSGKTLRLGPTLGGFGPESRLVSVERIIQEKSPETEWCRGFQCVGGWRQTRTADLGIMRPSL